MPSSRDPNAYSFEYHQLAELDLDKLPVTLTFSTKSAAQTFRFRVYGFIAALRFTHDPRLAKMQQLLLQIPPASPHCVTISNRDNSMPEIMRQLEESGALTPAPVKEPESTSQPSQPSAQDELIAQLFNLGEGRRRDK